MLWCGKDDIESSVLLALQYFLLLFNSNGTLIVRKIETGGIFTTFPFVEGIPKGLGLLNKGKYFIF